MVSKTKYYAVKVGRVPGIYLSWDECKKQVIGHPGALYKSFFSEAEARCYADGNLPAKAVASESGRDSDNHYDVFVDGSYYDGRYSWAFVVYENENVIFKKSGLGDNAGAAAIHNVAGEIAAVMEAVQWAEPQEVGSVTICHDYIGVSEWAKGNWKTNNQFTRDYAMFIAPYLSWVKFRKVSGHAGVEGNELADRLAKKALGLK